MKKSTKITIRSLIFLASAGIVGGMGYGIYAYSKNQKKKTYVYPRYTTIDSFFEDKAPVVKERFIAGERGYVVNKGPIRITSAYNSLFTKKSLINLADWAYHNISWGANAISLKNINFTTGIDTSKNGTTKGFHTAGRDGSSIYISPDAFEEINDIGDTTIKQFITKTIKGYDSKLSDVIESKIKSRYLSSIGDLRDDLENYLTKSYKNFKPNGLNITGTYNKPKEEKMEEIFQSMVSESWHDDYISTINSSTFAIRAQSTMLGNQYFSNPERIAYWIQNHKMDEALSKMRSKLAFILAYKSAITATHGNSQEDGRKGLGNVYLSLALRNILFKEDTRFSDDKGNPILFSLRPRSEWDEVAGIGDEETFTGENGNPFNVNLLPRNLREGYFRGLASDDNDQAVPRSTVNVRIAIYQLFLHYYDKISEILKAPDSPFSIVKEMWTNPSVQAANAWINEVRRYKATNRVAWFLTGEFTGDIKFNVLRDDEDLLTADDRTYIVKQNDIFGRSLNIDMKKTYSKLEEVPNENLGGLTLRGYFRKLLIDSMKYTISHEYGHHETMWSTFGVYGTHRNIVNDLKNKSLSVYDDTINIYSEQNAAKGEEQILERSFEILKSIAGKNSFLDRSIKPQEVGIKNALEIMMRANDKYSSTWTPTYTTHTYMGYNPSAGWGYSYEPLTRPSITITTDKQTGKRTMRLGRTIEVGEVPIQLPTRGVDGNSPTPTQNNYLFSIDKSSLSDDNPFKHFNRMRLKDFLRLMYSPDELLYGYQTTKWILSGGKEKVNGSPWAIKNRIVLPHIGDTSGLSRPTTRFTALLAQDPSDHRSKMMNLYGILQLQFGLSEEQAVEIISKIDDQIESLYNELIVKYPNLYESAVIDGTEVPRMSDYERSIAIFNQVINDTMDALKGVEQKDYLSHLKNKNRIFYDPDTITYKYLETRTNKNNGEKRLLEADELYKLFNNYKNDKLVKSGTITIGSAKSGFADYTGNYAEFMTRIVNQLQFRPKYSDFYIPGTKILDTATLTTTNEGWYDDLNRFASQGVYLYNVGEKGDMNSSLTHTGAKLINWYREILGLHVKNISEVRYTDSSKTKIDFNFLDNQIAWASPLTKIFKNSKTELTTMWGWIPENANYKYVVLVNEKTKHKVRIPIIASKNSTSHYFYYEDMSDKPEKRHYLNKGYKQWVAKWQVEGDYTNADISVGKYKMFFEGSNHELINPYANENIVKPTDGSPVLSSERVNFNNDYHPIFAEVVWITNDDEEKIRIEFR